jgi:hypothetical protein
VYVCARRVYAGAQIFFLVRYTSASSLTGEKMSTEEKKVVVTMNEKQGEIEMETPNTDVDHTAAEEVVVSLYQYELGIIKHVAPPTKTDSHKQCGPEITYNRTTTPLLYDFIEVTLPATTIILTQAWLETCCARATLLKAEDKCDARQRRDLYILSLMEYTKHEYQAIWAIQNRVKYTYATGTAQLAVERKHLEKDERANVHRLSHHCFAELFHEAFSLFCTHPLPVGTVLFSGEGHYDDESDVWKRVRNAPTHDSLVNATIDVHRSMSTSLHPAPALEFMSPSQPMVLVVLHVVSADIRAIAVEPLYYNGSREMEVILNGGLRLTITKVDTIKLERRYHTKPVDVVVVHANATLL